MNEHTLASIGQCDGCGTLTSGCLLAHRLGVGDITLEQFFEAHGAWSERQFGPSAGEPGKTRGPLGPTKHLTKELVREVLPALRDGIYKSDDEREIILEEFADLQLLLFDIVRRARFTADNLRAACVAKLKKNMARTWPPIGNLDGAIEHNRSASEKAHDGVDHLTELWAISDADCENNDAEGIAKAALRMIDRLQFAFRKSPVRTVRLPHRLPAHGVLRMACDQLVAMRRIAHLTADDSAVLESVIAMAEREIANPGGPMEAVSGKVATVVEPPPIPVAGVSVHDVITEDIAQRKAFGLGKYGVELRAGDGRRSLVDSYQELLDHVVYFRKYMLEHGIEVPSAAKAG